MNYMNILFEVPIFIREASDSLKTFTDKYVNSIEIGTLIAFLLVGFAFWGISHFARK